MRALFVKEWRQSYLLPWSGFLLSAMISVLYWAWSRSHVETIQDERDLNLFCATLAFVSAGVFLFVATASAFPSEKTRGTLPYLLALPVSRGRIWLAKALGALALAGAAALLLWVPLWVVVPQTIRELDP